MKSLLNTGLSCKNNFENSVNIYSISTIFQILKKGNLDQNKVETDSNKKCILYLMSLGLISGLYIYIINVDMYVHGCA